ncbi:MAG: DUF4199 domain-containing protein [Balneola sp.]|nr:MAG: DUF4199 domain-containing protein [Balneola sp.]
MENEEYPSYWSSVFIGAIIVGLIMSVLGLLSQYMTINSEPTGAPFGLPQLIGILVCLVGAIGGFFGVRHYAKENEITFPIGKGALIGLFVGLVGTLISTVISIIWTYLIDPDLGQAVYDWSIANLEAMGLTDDQLEAQMRFIPEPNSTSAMITQTGIWLAVLGILNSVSGLIGAKVFASEDED